MENSLHIELSHQDLSVDKCYEFVSDDRCGGMAIFVGTVRNHTKGKRVLKLEFSAYEPMAIKEMEKIARAALEKFGIDKIAIHHAIGELGIGAVPVIIAVSSSHRKASFEACQYAIDTLKETVPIWKKEFFEDGEVWVNSHP
jgi:molybdopterin synthase catalytic subunit